MDENSPYGYSYAEAWHSCHCGQTVGWIKMPLG